MNRGSIAWSFYAYIELDALDRAPKRRSNRLPGGRLSDDLGKVGRCWREADYETSNLETVIQDLMSGEYHDPIRVIGFNTNEGWSQDVSEDVAHELRRRCDLQMSDVPSSIQDFVERYEGHYRQLTLRLA